MMQTIYRKIGTGELFELVSKTAIALDSPFMVMIILREVNEPKSYFVVPSLNFQKYFQIARITADNDEESD